MPLSRSDTLSEKTLVFAGPTLAGLGDWRASLSDRFVFHPPVKCGNVLEAFHEGYRKMIIVDGFFERYAAVWHKEIMYFIDRGGVCVGCSSLGALRAVELAPFGMIGYGKVVEAFKSGRITDDDEVTVAHLDQSKDFVSLTDAMVNIRFTIDRALAAGAVEPADAEKILATAKSAFYKKRNLRLFASEVLREGPKLARFNAYLEQNGVFDAKRTDAVSLIEQFDHWLPGALETKQTSKEPINNTVLLQNLHYTININPPTLEKQALSPESRVLKLGGLLVGQQFHLVAKLAGAMMQYSKHTRDLPTPPFKPLPWLDERWLDGDEQIRRLVALAVEDCPEYASGKELPYSVRLQALTLEFPIAYVDVGIQPGHGDALATNATTNYSRLIFLIGLFLDGRLRHDELAQRLVPMDKMIDVRVAGYTLRGYETDEEQNGFLADFGLDNLRQAASRLERDSMLLTETDMGISFWFFEEDVYWYRLAVRVSGLWPQLASLQRKEVSETFAKELADDLSRLEPSARLRDLLLASLPTTMLSPESVLTYIGNVLDT
jgi:hypothetical protein